MKLSLSALVLAVLVLFSAPEARAACAAGPSWPDNGYWFYQHLFHDTNQLDCWTYSPTGVSNWSGSCGLSAATGIQFTGWSQQISQSVSINSAGGQGNGGTNWELAYELDFDDPNNDGTWNKVIAEVWYQDGGGTTFITSHSFTGADGDVSCFGRSLPFTGNYEGKNLIVIIKSSRGYANVVQRVRNINLTQRNP